MSARSGRTLEERPLASRQPNGRCSDRSELTPGAVGPVVARMRHCRAGCARTRTLPRIAAVVVLQHVEAAEGDGEGTMGWTVNGPGMRSRPTGSVVIVGFALLLIFGLVAMHALSQEGTQAQPQMSAVSVAAPQVSDQANGPADSDCSVCANPGASGLTDVWMAVVACAMFVFAGIWRIRGRAPLMRMRVAPTNAPDAASFRRLPPAMSVDLLALCVLRR